MISLLGILILQWFISAFGHPGAEFVLLLFFFCASLSLMSAAQACVLSFFRLRACACAFPLVLLCLVLLLLPRLGGRPGERRETRDERQSCDAAGGDRSLCLCVLEGVEEKKKWDRSTTHGQPKTFHSQSNTQTTKHQKPDPEINGPSNSSPP